jgi:Domain of unknown function (DUF1929)
MSNWIGFLGEQNSTLTAGWIGRDWVDQRFKTGWSTSRQGWSLRRGDQFYSADVDADNRDELIVVAPTGEWIGILRENSGGLVATWIKNDWVNEPGGTGASGWDLRQGDRYYVADIDADNRDELIVVAPTGEWIGILAEQGGSLIAGFIAYNWVNHPGGSGANGWDLKKGDEYLVADTDGTGRSRLVIRYLQSDGTTSSTGSSLMDSEILAIHAALLFTGEILYFGGDEHNPAQANNPQDFDRTRLFDVQSGIITRVGSPTTDIFCSGHAFLPDGRLLVGGGTEKYPIVLGHAHPLGHTGHRACWAYDPQARTWTQVADMNPNPNTGTPSGRWYPTLLTLHNGEILAVFGHPSESDTARHRNNTPERYSLNNNTWSLLPPVPGSEAIQYTQIMLNYPRLHLLRDTNIFFSTPVNDNRIYDPFTGSYVGNAIPSTGDSLYDESWNATSVLLPLLPGDNYSPRIMICGSTEPRVINLALSQPRWRLTAPRTGAASGRSRQFLCAVLLPTGEVFVTGGVGVSGQDIDAVFQAEIFSAGIDWNTDTYTWTADNTNTGTQAWTTVETASVPRNYHSVALLMPDGRVWTAGSSKNGDNGDPNIFGEKRIEIYSPWYCGASTRPEITSSPGGIGYGQTVEVRTPQAANIRRVALIRCGSVTHAFDSDQRYIGLTFQYAGGEVLRVNGPSDPAIAPPGYYMLWIIDDVGRPCSLAKFTRVPSVVQVTNILFNPPGPDLMSERLVIENQTAMNVNVTNWTIEDLKNHVFTFPQFLLATGAQVQLWTKGGVSDANNLYWGSGSPIWNNTGDTAILRNAQRVEISRYSFR